MTSILVTGGAGYVGSHTCKALRRAGFDPITYDNLARGNSESVKWGVLEIGELDDSIHLRETLTRYRPKAVVHFAALAYVGESNVDPTRYYQNNVGGTATLLEAMRQCGVSKIVFSSSCAIYGVPEVVPIPEETPSAPINPYGATKAICERMLKECAAAFPLSFMALRYFNAAGADPEGEIGECHVPETHAIPLVLEAAAGESKGFTIFGDDYATADGTCVRDYIHVTDLADAHVKATRALLDGVACPECGSRRPRSPEIGCAIRVAIYVLGLRPGVLPDVTEHDAVSRSFVTLVATPPPRVLNGSCSMLKMIAGKSKHSVGIRADHAS